MTRIRRHPLTLPLISCAVLVALAGCGKSDPAEGQSGGRPGGGGPPGGFGGGPPGQTAAVPVEVAPVQRRDISSYIETNGTLEAENEVDIVARVAAPIIELSTEEGRAVRRGQVLARLEADEIRARLEISRVALNEAELSLQRARELNEQKLISTEEFEQALNRSDTAKAELEGTQIQIDYTVVEAPFDGLIVARYVDYAQQVAVNTPLFRISDFDPLLCPIQVPERELPKLALGQTAYVQVEAWSDERFEAKVLRISPIVDAATGTIKVTLEVRSQGKLRPGMFARAFLRTDSREGALVIPRTALSLESIGDTVYVADAGSAQRREVELGFQEGDFVEIVTGLAENEQVVVIGQDGLSDGTPVQVLGGDSAPTEETRMATGDEGSTGPPTRPAATPQGAAPGGVGAGGGPARFDLSTATPEQLERIKETMRSRGLTEEQIEERIEMMRKRQQGGGGS